MRPKGISNMEKPSRPGYMTGLARQLRRSETHYEETLWACLRNRRLGNAKFRRQHPLGRYIPDFYCHEAGLAVELEGDVHDEGDQREYDAVRRETINQMRVRLLVFRNDEVAQDLERVLARILKALTFKQRAHRDHPPID